MHLSLKVHGGRLLEKGHSKHHASMAECFSHRSLMKGGQSSEQGEQKTRDQIRMQTSDPMMSAVSKREKALKRTETGLRSI